MKGHYIFSALLGIGLLLQGCETLDYTPADQFCPEHLAISLRSSTPFEYGHPECLRHGYR